MPDDKLTTALDGIRKRADAATPGPWRWRGNMDDGDPYLAGGHQRDADGNAVGFAQDVLGHIPHEVTRAEARRRIDPDCLPEPDVAPLPSETYDKRYDAACKRQMNDAITEAMTDKYGEPLRESRLAFCSDNFYKTARELAVYEVCPQATHRDDRRVYRADITGIRHPNAEFIEHSREDMGRLLAAVDAVTELIAMMRAEVVAHGGGFEWNSAKAYYADRFEERISRALLGPEGPEGASG